MASDLRPYGGYWEPTPKMDRPSCPEVVDEDIASFSAGFLANTMTIESREVCLLSSPPVDAQF